MSPFCPCEHEKWLIQAEKEYEETMNISEYAAIEKLRLSNEESSWIERCARFLEESFRELESADTDGVEPLVTVLDVKNVLREDTSYKMLSREELLANAPEQYDGYFQVPKTLD